MVMTIRVMSSGKGYEYLLKSVVVGDGDREMSSPLTRYYTETGSPPGTWVGTGLMSLDNARPRSSRIPASLRPGQRTHQLRDRPLTVHGRSTDTRKGLAEIGFVATAARFQGQGVGTALLHHIKEQLSEPDSAATCHFADVSEGNGHVTHPTL